MAQIKQNNLDIFNYIHWTKENFLLTQKATGAAITDHTAQTRALYQAMAARAEGKMKSLNSATNNINELISLIASVNDGANIEQLVDIDAAGEEEIMNRIRNAIALVEGTGMNIRYQNFGRSSADEQLATLVSSINSVIEASGKIDQALLDYYATKDDTGKGNIKSIFSSGINPDQLSILAVNPTALTSLTSLASRIQLIKNNTIQAQGNGTVTYTTSKGVTKTVPISSLIYSMKQLLINIMGGYGEAIAAMRIVREVDEITQKFAKSASGNNIKVTVEGTGATKVNGQTSKADVAITYNEDGVSVSMGISAKAQQSSSEGRTTPITTTFQTSALSVFLQAVVLNKQEEYIFLNQLYHGMSAAKEQGALRRYIAAANFDKAVTGFGFDKNEVVFLSYLDRVITVSDFFMALLSTPDKKLPTLSFPKVKASIGSFVGKIDNESQIELDMTPTEKNELAWIRSNITRQMLLALQAQIQFQH